MENGRATGRDSGRRQQRPSAGGLQPRPQEPSRVPSPPPGTAPVGGRVSALGPAACLMVRN